MFKEILIAKFKLYFRNNFDHNFIKNIKINYMLIFIPFYLFLLYNVSELDYFLYTLLCYFLLVLGLDFHTISNKSNLNSLMLFGNILSKRKTIEINLFTEYFIKFIILVPILLVTSNYLLTIFIGSIFIFLSFFLKELISNNTISKKIYFIFFFVYLFFFSMFGGLFAQEKGDNNFYVEYINVHYFQVILILTIIHSFVAFLLLILYLKKFHKIPSCE